MAPIGKNGRLQVIWWHGTKLILLIYVLCYFLIYIYYDTYLHNLFIMIFHLPTGFRNL